MSEEDNSDGKTELPSDKKLADAIEQGNTPFSREIVSFGSLLAIVASLHFLLPDMTHAVTSLLLDHFATLEQVALQSPGDAARLLNSITQKMLVIMGPLLVLLALGGLISAMVQNVPSAVLDRVTPKWNRLSPAANLKKIVGRESFIESAKMTAKFVALAILTFVVLKKDVGSVFRIGLGEPSLIPKTMLQSLVGIVVPTTIFVFLLSVVDIVWTRLKWRHDLKMTRQELKEEHKNAEGDPIFKQRRRLIAQKLSRSRMIADVPKATLVIVNPTHFAVALRYIATEGGAPVVLAKGLDHVALKIKEVSAAHDIPTIENKPLARSLFSVCEVGEMIPPDFYKAIAEVIHFVESKRQLNRDARHPKRLF